MKYIDRGLSQRDARFLADAVSLSKLSSCRQKHGAIIRKAGKTLAVGINADVNHPTIFDASDNNVKAHAAIHAEVAALNACKKSDLSGATIYIARTNRAGTPMMSKPCERCQAALRARGVKKVIYTINHSLDLEG